MSKNVIVTMAIAVNSILSIALTGAVCAVLINKNKSSNSNNTMSSNPANKHNGFSLSDESSNPPKEIVNQCTLSDSFESASSSEYFLPESTCNSETDKNENSKFISSPLDIPPQFHIPGEEEMASDEEDYFDDF